MGLFSRKSKEEKQAEMSARMEGLAAERPFEAEPYDGEPFPGGSFGAIPVPGRLMVPLRPGKYKVVYRVKGNPAFHDAVRGTGRWEPPTIDFSIKPADDVTPRLSATIDAGNGMINSLGWST